MKCCNTPQLSFITTEEETNVHILLPVDKLCTWTPVGPSYVTNAVLLLEYCLEVLVHEYFTAALYCNIMVYIYIYNHLKSSACSQLDSLLF